MTRQDKPLPEWKTGKPPRPGVYFGFSNMWQRMGDKPGVYQWDGAVFQHSSGWFDNAITHWMETDLDPTPEAGSSETQTGA